MKKLFLVALLILRVTSYAETVTVVAPNFHSLYEEPLDEGQIQEKIIEKQDQIESLTVQGYLTPGAASSLLSASFPLLKSLDLYIGINYFELKSPLNHFAPNLKHLAVNMDSFFWAGNLNNLILFTKSFEKLESLSLTSIFFYPLIENRLKEISLLPSLKELHLQTRMISVDFADLYNLEKLNLSRCTLGSLDLAQFLSFDHLRSLNLSYITYNNKASANLPIDFRILSKIDSLEDLNLSGIHLSPENIEQTFYETLPNLKELILNDSYVKGTHFSVFAPNLKRLSLYNSNITGGDIVHIAQLKDLEFLEMGSTSVSGAIIKKLTKLVFLQELHLGSTNMSKANFVGLPSSIEILDLAGSTLSLASFNSLYALTHLKKLDLRNIQNSNITQAMIQDLQEVLSSCEVLY